MKKLLALILVITTLFAFAACGGAKTPTDADTATDAAEGYTNATEVLVSVFDAYAEENKFPVAGGDEENQSFEGPAKYSVEKADELANATSIKIIALDGSETISNLLTSTASISK